MTNRYPLESIAVFALAACCAGSRSEARHHNGAANQVPAGGTSQGCTGPVALDLSGPRPAFDITSAQGKAIPAILDTGAMNTTINVTFADALGLRRDGPLLPPFEKHGAGYQSTLKGARIGTLAIPNHSVAVMPSLLADKGAIISPAAFRGRLVKLDFGSATLSICEKRAGRLPKGEGYPYNAKGFVLPTIPVTVQGRTITALLDTGSPFTLILPESYVQKLDLSEPLKKIGEAATHGGVRHPIYRSTVRGSIAVGPLVLASPQVYFSNMASGPNIGMAALRQLSVTIDPAAKRSWVEPSAAKVAKRP